MRYYKLIEGDYITMVGTGNGGTEITDAEYAEIMSIIRNKPEETATIGYRLKTDLTWESSAKEKPEEEPEPTSDEILDILLGGGE